MKQPKHVTNWGGQGETPADNSAPARQRSLQHSAHATRSVRAAHHRHATTPQSPPPGNVGMTVQMKSKRIVALRTDNKAERDTAAVMRARNAASLTDARHGRQDARGKGRNRRAHQMTRGTLSPLPWQLAQP